MNYQMNQLTTKEVALITHKLKDISDTWSDLWVFLCLVPVSVGQVISLKHRGFDGKYLVLEKGERFKRTQIEAPPLICELIQRRRERYPDDIYIFQSHSNRVKFKEKPVTVIAFNRALKFASKDVTDAIVTSKSAKC
ncbi:TPA: hypothetical protein ACJI8J_002754 [Kluyvera georgiana]|uniref:hypothetical protein n=1 Tax=Kluyvera TaxID=579 RepID=UPI00205B8075|nr:hypothetical protein [Kluyvera ascorbata]UPQ72426.1 hypothetical protein MY052_03730 [Kluyvera ascorbata]